MELPLSIPNRVVKRCTADDTRKGTVGSRQYWGLNKTLREEHAMGTVTRIPTRLSLEAIELTPEEQEIEDALSSGEYESLPLEETMKYVGMARRHVRNQRHRQRPHS